MVFPVSGTLSVYHNEFHIMIYATDHFSRVMPAMARAVFVTDSLLYDCFRATWVRAVSDTRIRYPIRHVSCTLCP